MKKAIIIASALGLALTGTAASAEDVRVYYGDLNLSTAKGQQQLERRIAWTIGEMCKSREARTGSMLRSTDSIKCERKAKASSKEQVAIILEKKGYAQAGLGG